MSASNWPPKPPPPPPPPAVIALLVLIFAAIIYIAIVLTEIKNAQPGRLNAAPPQSQQGLQ